MTISRRQKNEEIRARYLKLVSDLLAEKGDEILRVKSNEIAIPTTDMDDEEQFLVLTFKVPTGANKGLEPYDGYAEAENYAHALKEKEIKAQKVAEQKAKKAKRDAEIRRKRAEIAEKNKG